jgi:hypothetical protein
MKTDRVMAWLSLGAPLLVVLAFVAAQQRDGYDKVQALPAAAIGSILVVSCALGRRRRRARLFADLKRLRLQDGDG